MIQLNIITKKKKRLRHIFRTIGYCCRWAVGKVEYKGEFNFISQQ